MSVDLPSPLPDTPQHQVGDNPASLSEQQHLYLLSDSKYQPKDWNEDLLTGFVWRQELLEVWSKIEYSSRIDNRSVPGLYIAGPPGSGKSSIMYLCVLKARRDGILAPYVARCDDWAELSPTVAKGFFIDIVKEANDAIKGGGEGHIHVPEPPSLDGKLYKSWEAYAGDYRVGPQEEGRVDKMLDYVHGQLRDLESPVILFFDDHNALLEKSVDGRDAISLKPFSLAHFLSTYKCGCVVLSGPTDMDFSYRLKGRHDTHVISLGCLSEKDFETWLDSSSQFSGYIADLYRHTCTSTTDKADIRREIGLVTGKNPRELRKFCSAQAGMPLPNCTDPEEMSQFFSRLQLRYIADLETRTTNLYQQYLVHNPDSRSGILGRIMDLCTKATPKVVFNALFWALGFIYKAGNEIVFLTPTTREVLLRITVQQMIIDAS